jgi:septum site-determining protein MinC
MSFVMQTPLRAFGVLLVNELPHDAKPAKSSQQSKAQEERAKVKLPSAVSAQFVHGTVRSGQQVYAEGRSLVILGGVNEGAEVMADGDIHVYGRLQGRAVAGLSGDRSAKVNQCVLFEG